MRCLTSSLLALSLLLAAPALAQDAVHKLPAPDTRGGMPLMQALNERHSVKQFGDKAIDDQTLSDLLWAAYGVNRSGGAGGTTHHAGVQSRRAGRRHHRQSALGRVGTEPPRRQTHRAQRPQQAESETLRQQAGWPVAV